MLSTTGRKNGKEPSNGSLSKSTAMDSIELPGVQSCSWQASVHLSAAIFNLKVKTKTP